ncbi:ABC transporter substrate-binding protein [Xanthobacter sp. V3C-3]|uniref:ABC transporter substrate-binding protein n=1 Tax=Xanthobacter lutulentifluminis TaxID=3119935 RepID=UPI003729C83F
MKVALITPVSGPMARQGDLMRKGAELAIEDINAAGGIKALGGARLSLVVEDAGDKVETAKNAAQRLVANRAGVVAGTGAWSSSLTLAITEVTERAELPWLTLSYADQITDRGFRYVVQTVPVASQLALNSMPTVLDMAQAASGRRPTKVAIISDSTAASQAFVTPLRDGGFQKLGVTVVADDVFTPPLTDATAMIQKLRATRPDFLLFYSTSFPDAKLVLNKMNEFGLGKGKLPAVTVGVQLASPEILKAVGPELLEGLVVVAPNWPSKAQEAALPGLTRRSGEPWLGQDTISTYGDIWLIKDALERAGSTDSAKVMAALRATNRADGPADYYLGDRLAFDDKGRRLGGAVGLVQWQGGAPYLIWPKEDAVRTPLWPKS